MVLSWPKRGFTMNDEETKYLQDCMALLSNSKTLQLATVDQQGWPHISYAPYIRQDEHFYIYVSQLASHTQYLQQTPKASVMIIRDEMQSRNVFVRERIIVGVHVEVADSEDTSPILDRMEAQLGGTVALLRTLPDFVLFKLSTVKARYIAGFGKAFEFDIKQGKLEHISAAKLTKS